MQSIKHIYGTSLMPIDIEIRTGNTTYVRIFIFVRQKSISFFNFTDALFFVGFDLAFF